MPACLPACLWHALSLWQLQANLKNKLQMVTNISNVLKFISEQGVRVTLSAEDVYDGKDKLILGLLWVLILKYQV